VDGLGNQVLAGAGLAQDDDVGAALGRLDDQLEDLAHARVLADDGAELVPVLQGPLEFLVLLHQLELAHLLGADVDHDAFQVQGGAVIVVHAFALVPDPLQGVVVRDDPVEHLVRPLAHDGRVLFTAHGREVVGMGHGLHDVVLLVGEIVGGHAEELDAPLADEFQSGVEFFVQGAAVGHARKIVEQTGQLSLAGLQVPLDGLVLDQLTGQFGTLSLQFFICGIVHLYLPKSRMATVVSSGR
jgi:hypothetical protein